MQNCKDIPNWNDSHGNTCQFYTKNPNTCKKAKYLTPNRGPDATTACCVCRNTIPDPLPYDSLVPDERVYNPCPEGQLWGDFGRDDDYFSEVGTAVCPPGVECDMAIRDGNIVLNTGVVADVGIEQGCWKNLDPRAPPVLTCGNDTWCRNLDVQRSSSQELVYKCPNATCSIGQCQCGPECVMDNVTQICIPPSELQTPTHKMFGGKQPIPVPPRERCTLTNFGKNSSREEDSLYGCWKRTQDNNLVSCDPGFCGIQHLDPQSSIMVAGRKINVYKSNDKIKNISQEPPHSSSEPPHSSSEPTLHVNKATTPLAIIGYIIGVILLGVIIFAVVGEKKSQRRSGFG